MQEPGQGSQALCLARIIFQSFTVNTNRPYLCITVTAIPEQARRQRTRAQSSGPSIMTQDMLMLPNVKRVERMSKVSRDKAGVLGKSANNVWAAWCRGGDPTYPMLYAFRPMIKPLAKLCSNCRYCSPCTAFHGMVSLIMFTGQCREARKSTLRIWGLAK
jgi:hypothetical protein